jgi:HK97 family phage major capsid protein
MRIDEITARLTEIRGLIDTASGAELTALEDEVKSLTAERHQIQDEAQTRQQMRDSIAAGLVTGTTIEKHEEENKMENRTFTLESEEYRSAFLKSLRREDMNEAETRAFTFLTSNTTAPLPTVMQNRIIDLIGQAHPIVADVYTMNSNTAITIPVAKAITADAGQTEEGAASNELNITFEDVNLAGNDYTANVKLSYRMQRMAIPAFEDYLVSQIAARLGAKLAVEIVEDIRAVHGHTGEEAAIDYATLCRAFGGLKRTDKVVVYGNRKTIFAKLVGMVDLQGRPIFQNSINASAAGTLLGATIKFEDALDDGHLLICDPSKYIQNVVAPIIIESGKDLDNHIVTYSGYTCQEGCMMDEGAFTVIEGSLVAAEGE